MPTANQFVWQHKELVTTLIKAAGIHEGRWWLLTNLSMSVGNFGPSDDEVSPGAVVVINHIGLQREMPGTLAPRTLVVDAAEVNPAPKPGLKLRAPSKSKD